MMGGLEIAHDVPHPVSLEGLRPAGFRILAALQVVGQRLDRRLQVTCGTNNHPPDDPHTTGEAVDIRVKTLPKPVHEILVRSVAVELADHGDLDAPLEKDGGWVTTRFFALLEDPGTDNAHLHVQRRRGTVYP